MSGSGAREQLDSQQEVTEDNEVVEDQTPAAAGPVTRRRAGRPPTRNVRISMQASSRDPKVASDAPPMPAWMQNIEHKLEQLVQVVSAAQGSFSTQDQDHYEATEADDDSAAGSTTAPQPVGRQPRSIPLSGLISHIPRRSLAWWDNHPSGTPIAYKDLPGVLRQAMDKNPRDRLEVQQEFTALLLTASLVDAFAAAGDGNLTCAQFGMELILNHLFPLLARRVDALQQDGSLRSAFMLAQDPRSQYFIADPETSYGILQKVSSARVQALMAAAGRRGGRNEDDDRRSSNRNSNRQRQAAAGSPGQRARDRSSANSRTNNTGGSSRRSGSSRDRGGSRERRSSRDGAASRSNPADSSSRGADHN